VQTAILKAKVNELETKTDRIESALLDLIAVHKQTERNIERSMVLFKDEIRKDTKSFKEEMRKDTEKFKEKISNDTERFKEEMRKNTERFTEKISNDTERFKEEMRKNTERFTEKISNDTERFKEEMKKDTEKFKQEMNRRWGELSERLGTIAEDIFAPGVPYLAKRLGWEVRKRMLDVEYRKENKIRQYDVIVWLVDEKKQERVLVAEVKSKVRPEDFQQLKEALEDLLFFESEIKPEQIIPVLAGFTVPTNLFPLAAKRKVLLVSMGGDYLEPLNPEVLTSY